MKRYFRHTGKTAVITQNSNRYLWQTTSHGRILFQRLQNFLHPCPEQSGTGRPLRRAAFDQSQKVADVRPRDRQIPLLSGDIRQQAHNRQRLAESGGLMVGRRLAAAPAAAGVWGHLKHREERKSVFCYLLPVACWLLFPQLTGNR